MAENTDHHEGHGLARIHPGLDAIDTALETRLHKIKPGEIRLGAFTVALRMGIRLSGSMQDLVVDTLTHRPNIGPSHAITLIQRAIQARAYGTVEGYPEQTTTPESWLELFNTVMDDPDMAGQVVSDIYSRDPQSLVIDRYKLPRLTTFLAKRMGRTSIKSMLDVGSSLNGGGAYIVSDTKVDPPTRRGFSQTRTGLYTPDVIVPGTELLRPDELLTDAIHLALNDPDSALERVLGVDRTSPEDGWDWAFANSFNPDELMNVELVEFFNDMVRRKRDNVGFLRLDFSKLNGNDQDVGYDPEKDEFAKANPEGWDVVNMSTMLYMATPKQRKFMLDRAKYLAKELIIASDFMRVSADGQELEFLDDWNEGTFPYVTAVWDKRGDSPGWQTVIMSTDGRVREITLGPGRITNSNGEPKTLWTPIGEFIVRNLEERS